MKFYRDPLKKLFFVCLILQLIASCSKPNVPANDPDPTNTTHLI